MERFARTFQSQSWPKKVHALIPALAAAFTLETKALAGWSKTSVSTRVRCTSPSKHSTPIARSCKSAFEPLCRFLRIDGFISSQQKGLP